jgi:hypothetical protein
MGPKNTAGRSMIAIFLPRVCCPCAHQCKEAWGSIIIARRSSPASDIGMLAHQFHARVYCLPVSSASAKAEGCHASTGNKCPPPCSNGWIRRRCHQHDAKTAELPYPRDHSLFLRSISRTTDKINAPRRKKVQDTIELYCGRARIDLKQTQMRTSRAASA